MNGIATAVLAATLAVATPVLGQSVYTVDRDQVNVRADATTQAQRIGVLARGAQVVELRRHGQWLQVQLAAGERGWIHSQLLQQRYVIEGEGVRLREGPSTQNTSVTMMFRGQEVGRLGQRGNWTQVRTEDGRTGWLSSRYLRAKTADDLNQERPAVQPPPAASTPTPPTPASQPTEGPAVSTGEEFAILERNPYAEGLRHEAGGEHAEALARFEEVLVEEPAHVNALVHAAQAHRHLGQYGEGLDKLYRALDITGGRKDVYLTLGEVYRLRSEPDSAAKYQALFRGRPTAVVETEAPVEEVAAVEPISPVVEDVRPLPDQAADTDEGGAAWFDSPWLLLAMAGIGLLALAGVAWWVVSTSAPRPSDSTQAKGRFSKVWKEEAEEADQGRATPEEERELDHQIDDKWRELRASAEAFRPAPTEGEADAVAGVLDQVEGLRRSLEGQDERAGIYADIVRLQNMKIDAMTEEIRRLRARGKERG